MNSTPNFGGIVESKEEMDVSIAVPSPRVHSDAASATPSAAISLPSPTAPTPTTPPQQQATPPNSMDTGQTTLVHARLDARDVMAGSCDSGQEDEELTSVKGTTERNSQAMRRFRKKKGALLFLFFFIIITTLFQMAADKTEAGMCYSAKRAKNRGGPTTPDTRRVLLFSEIDGQLVDDS